ncbi:MAG: homoserine O-acetyltransferase [Wenzhouxiangellaceae bacterium]
MSAIAATANPASTTPPLWRDHRLDLGDFTLEHGLTLPQAKLCCRLYGDYGPRYLILGGISADRRLGAETEARGWWPQQVGHGRPLDPRFAQLISIDYLASGDSSRPQQTGEWALSTIDQARAIIIALDQLGIERLDGVIGASYGGMVALALARHFPQRVCRALILCAAHRSSPTTAAYRSLQRQIVRFAERYGDAAEGLRLARGLAMLGFRSRREIDQRFDVPGQLINQQLQLPVDAYLNARGADFARRTDSASFHCLSQSCDQHAIEPEQIPAPLWLAACRDDQIIPHADVAELAARAPLLQSFVTLESPYGHDCFLKETHAIGRVIQHFIAGGAV